MISDNFLLTVFDHKNYHGYRLSKERDSITVHDMVDEHGEKFDLKFQKTINHWEVEVRTDAKYHSKPEPNHAQILSGVHARNIVKTFWYEMEQKVYESNSDQIYQNRSGVMGVLMRKDKDG